MLVLLAAVKQHHLYALFRLPNYFLKVSRAFRLYFISMRIYYDQELFLIMTKTDSWVHFNDNDFFTERERELAASATFTSQLSLQKKIIFFLYSSGVPG